MKYQVDLKTFGRWLREYRKDAKLTQAEAAGIANISRVRWSQLERGVGSRPRRSTACRIARAIKRSTGRALELLNYPDKDIERAYDEEKSHKNRLASAMSRFQETLLSDQTDTVAAFLLMDIYRDYRRRVPSQEVQSALNPFAYQRAIEAVAGLDPRHQWLLAREVISYLWKSRSMLCYPEIPEFKEFNDDQTRVLKIAARSIKEFRYEARMRYQAKTDEYRKSERQKQRGKK